MKHLPVLLALWTLPAPRAVAIPPGQDGQRTLRASVALTELRVEDAARELRRPLNRHPTDADVLAVAAMLHFHRGDYGPAVTAMERSVDGTTELEALSERRALRSLFRATAEATRGFERAASPDGRYVVVHAPGSDAVLVPWALEALEAADRGLFEELGYRVPGPIRLEIYPSPRALADVSTLTVEEIERTGTIALCKWDRLMITSPRALTRGYPWVDTLSHELVHLVLARMSKNRAPVWFQEGVAKFLERRWRGERPSAHVEPAVDALLYRAVRAGALIPFDRIHPSIARLPSQEDAALAFAQVSTFIDVFHASEGREGLIAAIELVAAGTDARDALAEVAGVPWARLETRWRAALRARPAPAAEPPRLLAMRFHGAASDDAQDVTIDRARRFLRLGDLLWQRGRARAAAAEYEKAHDAAPDDPIVASRFGRAAVEGGRGGVAIDALTRVRDLYPDYAPIQAVLGAALLADGRRADARVSLIEAIRLNPFDPSPHCDLALATDHAEQRATARAGCTALGGARR